MSKKVMWIAAAIILVAALFPTTLDAQVVRDTIYRQNFDSTWSTTTPPTGWQIIYTDGDASGSQGNNDWRRAQQSGSDYYAYLYYSPSNTSTDRLISPVFDCSNPLYQTVWVQVWTSWNRYANPYTAQIRGSADGGASFPNIIYDYTATRTNTTDNFDITAFALGEDDVSIDFYGDGYIWNINYWYVDDFMIYGEWIDGGGPGGDTVDLEMAHILRPLQEEAAGVPFTPACKVLNMRDTVNADVMCKITDLSNMQVIYDKVLSDFPFPPGYTTVDQYPDFTPAGGKKYKVIFVVTNIDDINPANNDKTLSPWYGVIGVEVSPTEILAPADAQLNGFKPSAKFLEKAGKADQEAWLHYLITGPTLAVMEDSVNHVFAANEEYTVEFGDILDLATGTYNIAFWATDKDGGKISVPPAGISKSFGYEAVAEQPKVTKNALSVSGGTVSYTLANPGTVSVKVYDAVGNLVATLASGSETAGPHTRTFTANPGVYFVKLVTSDFSAVRKATIIN